MSEVTIYRPGEAPETRSAKREIPEGVTAIVDESTGALTIDGVEQDPQALIPVLIAQLAAAERAKTLQREDALQEARATMSPESLAKLGIE